MVAAALEGLDLAIAESLAATAEILRCDLGAEAHVAAQITRMGRRGQDGVEMRRQLVSARLIGIEDLEAVGRLAPDFDVRRVQAQAGRQFRSALSRRFGQRTEQAEMHAKVDQVNGIESAPPLENARDLRIGGNFRAVLSHCLPSRS